MKITLTVNNNVTFRSENGLMQTETKKVQESKTERERINITKISVN